jgi:hypothetical protein
VFALSSTVRCVSTASGRSSRSTAATLQLGSDIESNALLLHRRNRLSTSSTVMPTIVVSESASQAISSAVTAVALKASVSGKHGPEFLPGRCYLGVNQAFRVTGPNLPLPPRSSLKLRQCRYLERDPLNKQICVGRSHRGVNAKFYPAALIIKGGFDVVD